MQHPEVEQGTPRSCVGRTTVWLLRGSTGPALLLALLTLAVYLPSLWNGFVEYDDPFYVTANPHVRTGFTWDNLRWAFSFQSLNMGIWGPLFWLSHQLDCQLFGLTPAGHHATSIVLHGANAFLLCLLLIRATGSLWKSWFAAALFALHPLNVENVSWIAERKSLVCMLLLLCTVGLYGWYASRPSVGRYLATCTMFSLSLLAKPLSATLPVLLLLIDIWPLGRVNLERWNSQFAEIRGLIFEKLPLLAISAVFSCIAFVSEKQSGALESHIPIALRLRSVAVDYLLYLRKTVWPVDLTYFYPHPLASVPLWLALVCSLTLLVFTAAVLRLRGHLPLKAGWLFYLVAMLPMCGLVQIGAFHMADRFAYLPLIGIFTALGWELSRIAGKLHVSGSVQAVIACFVLLVASACTIRTEGYWHDNLTLFSHARSVTKRPDLLIETNYCGALGDTGRIDEALDCYRRTVALAPTRFMPNYNVGYSLARMGRFDQAVNEFRQALACTRDPQELARGYRSLGIAYLNLGEGAQAQIALEQASVNGGTDADLRGLIESAREMSVQHR